MSTGENKIGLIGLASMVAGSMIGGGMFAMPQNMSAHAALGPILIAWAITFIGMFGLVRLFMLLSDTKPELSAGIYSYAREGFGDFWGFNIAWGYWLATAFGNVAFAVMMNDALGDFFPVFLDHGWPTVALGLTLIWVFYFVVASGVQQAASMNTITLVIKVAAILLILSLLIFFFNFDMAKLNFWGSAPDLGTVFEQTKAPMVITLWAFIGIEGAVVVSGRARNKSDVGKATFLGFIVVFALYVLMSTLSFGVLKQEELAVLTDPSAAYLFPTQLGSWYADFVSLALLVSVGGAWIAWTIIVAEVPMSAAEDGALPKFFTKRNAKGAPSGALLISSIVMTISMFAVVLAKDVYFAAVSISAIMYLPAYLFSAGYLSKASANGTFLEDKTANKKTLIIGIWATLYCIWLFYAAGVQYLLLSSIFYAAGIPVYYYTLKEKGGDFPSSGATKIASVIFIALAIVTIGLLATNNISV